MSISDPFFYIIASLISILCLGIAAYAIVHRYVPGATALAIIMFASMEYAVPYTLQMTSHNLAAAMLLYNLSLPGANLLGPAWLGFALSWTRQDQTISKRRKLTFILLVLAIPSIVCLAAWTNTLHGLYGTNFHLIQNNSITSLEWTSGLFYWVGFLYAYAMFAAGLIIILYNALKRLRLFFWQSILLIIGTFIPVILNTTFVSGLIPGQTIDIAPFAFLITGVIWSLAIFLFHFLSIVPIAHQSVFKQMPVGVIVIDHQRILVDINPAAIRMLGVSMRTIGQELPELPKDILTDLYEKSFESSETGKDKIICVGKGCHQRYLDVQQTPVLDRHKQVIGTLFLLNDVTERERAEQALFESEIKFRGLYEASPIGIELYDAGGKLVDVNANGLQIFGLSDSSYVRGFDLFEDPNLSEPIKEHLLLGESVRYEALFDFDIVQEHNLYPTTRSGKIFIDSQITPLLNEQAVIDGYMVQVQEITERKQMEAALNHQSTHDNLTGLFNRQYYESEIERLQQSQRYPISILMVDMNGLKEINDTYGHSAGDELLYQAGHLIKSSFRPNDTVARIGGDEYVIVLPETSAKVASLAIQRLKEGMIEHNRGCLPHHQISLSIGAATCEDPQADLHEVLKQADQAMYREKAEIYTEPHSYPNNPE